MAGGAVTENPLVRVPVWLLGLVTVTLRVPTVAVELMVMLAVSCVAELNAQEFTVIPAPKLQVAPLWKALPVMMTLGKLCPCAPELGLTEPTVGGGGGPLVVTANPFGNVPLWVSGLVTVTLRVPTVAVELMVMLAVSCVAEL